MFSALSVLSLASLPGTNPTWSLEINFVRKGSIWLARIFAKIFRYVFRSEMGR